MERPGRRVNHRQSFVRPAAWLVAVMGALCLLWGPRLLAADPAAPPATRAAPAVAPAPVILLTGFEPFGPGRPPNPAWEGIKRLDGQAWKGYRLVCRQMKVVWAAPLVQLQEWICQCHPVAVFSFGQGMAGAFSLESRASNHREMLPDNDNHLPPQPAIVTGGPATLSASSDCAGLARLLRAQGYAVRVSTCAGGYLCEEALYSLEFLQARDKLHSVLFCHVPPLGSRVDGRPVSGQLVQQFVRDLLQAWLTLDHGQQAPAAVPPAQGKAKGSIP